MYKDKINVLNKIITSSILDDIFNMMNDEILKYKELSKKEEKNNQSVKVKNQVWNYKDFKGSIKFDVVFTDGVNKSYSDFSKFNDVFSSKLKEIEKIDVDFNYSYFVCLENKGEDKCLDNITLSISSNEMIINSNLSSRDALMDDVLRFIKGSISDASLKNDELIKDRANISDKVGFSIGMIPALVVGILLALLPVVKDFYITSFVGFTIFVLLLGVLIGYTIGKININLFYSKILSNDNVDVLIGKKVGLLRNRHQIDILNNKYTGWLPVEIAITGIINIIILIIK